MEPTTATTNTVQQRSFSTALLLAIFLGGFGIDRFYMGKTGTGILKLLLAGGAGLWWLFDIIMIVSGSARDKQGQPLKRG